MGGHAAGEWEVMLQVSGRSWCRWVGGHGAGEWVVTMKVVSGSEMEGRCCRSRTVDKSRAIQHPYILPLPLGKRRALHRLLPGMWRATLSILEPLLRYWAISILLHLLAGGERVRLVLLRPPLPAPPRALGSEAPRILRHSVSVA